MSINYIGELTPPWHRLDAVDGLYLRSLRYGAGQKFLLRMNPLDSNGNAITNAKWVGSPGVVRLLNGNDRIEATFVSANELVIEGFGMGVELEGFPGYFDFIRELGSKQYRYTISGMKTALDIWSESESFVVDAPWDATHSKYVKVRCLPGTDRTWKIYIHEVAAQAPAARTPLDTQDPHLAFEKAVAPLVKDLPDRPTALLAAHCLWVNQAGPFGLLTRNAIFASKAWMNSAFGWDTCFHALSIADAWPEVTWDQLALFFDKQDDYGVLPGLIQPDNVSYNFMLPPIQGWTVLEIYNKGILTRERKEWLYPRLSSWTHWWMMRDEDNDGIPQYNHGNDSGWDNGTAFAEGVPIESPDLTAFLIVQCDALARIASDLGRDNEAIHWESEAQRLYGLLLEHFWDGERFVPKHNATHKVCPGDSLLSMIPIIIGKRLDKEAVDSIVNALRDEKRFLAPFGLATESISSTFYSSDSYWRGCVWASPTWLIIRGLIDIGEKDLALDIAKRFMRACTVGGMAENFDPLTGNGWRDLHYGWTAAVYLLCARLVNGQ